MSRTGFSNCLACNPNVGNVLASSGTSLCLAAGTWACTPSTCCGQQRWAPFSPVGVCGSMRNCGGVEGVRLHGAQAGRGPSMLAPGMWALPLFKQK